MQYQKMYHRDSQPLLLGIAHGFFDRLRGLLGVTHLGANEGLLIQPCSSIHTIGMSIPIDVLFLDRDDKVLRVCHNVLPGRFRFGPAKTVKTVELAAGVAGARCIVVSDQLSVRPANEYEHPDVPKAVCKT